MTMVMVNVNGSGRGRGQLLIMPSGAGLVWLELSCGRVCGCCYDRVSESKTIINRQGFNDSGSLFWITGTTEEAFG